MSAPDTTADTSPLADAARIRELMLANLFAVFGERNLDTLHLLSLRCKMKM